MKKVRYYPFLWAAFVLSFTAFLATAQLAPARTPIALKHLQGHWEGEGSGGKCSITIIGNLLRYSVGTNWHETTFTLPVGTDPQQLHATIKDSWPPEKDSIGTVVPAIIKIEDGTLTLLAYNMSQDPPKTFEAADTSGKYVLKQVQPKKENPKPPATK